MQRTQCVKLSAATNWVIERERVERSRKADSGVEKSSHFLGHAQTDAENVAEFKCFQSTLLLLLLLTADENRLTTVLKVAMCLHWKVTLIVCPASTRHTLWVVKWLAPINRAFSFFLTVCGMYSVHHRLLPLMERVSESTESIDWLHFRFLSSRLQRRLILQHQTCGAGCLITCSGLSVCICECVCLPITVNCSNSSNPLAFHFSFHCLHFSTAVSE